MEEVYRVMLQGMMARGWDAAAHARQREPAAAVLDRGAIRNHLMARTVHIIGAGLAGLAAAVKLAPSRGATIVVHEATAYPGGRCRSYFDRTIGMTIDNGNHLVLSGNHAVLDFAQGDRQRSAAWSDRRRRSFRSSICRPASAGRLRINDGLPWWIFDKSRRVPGHPSRRISAAGAAAAGRRPTRRLADVDRLLGPALSSAGASAAAGGAEHRAARGLGGAGVGGGARDAGAGGQACRPLIARDGLGPTFIEPAIKHLRERNVEVRLDHELRALRFDGDRIAELDFGAETDDARTPAMRSSWRCRAMPRRRLFPD